MKTDIVKVDCRVYDAIYVQYNETPLLIYYCQYITCMLESSQIKKKKINVAYTKLTKLTIISFKL